MDFADIGKSVVLRKIDDTIWHGCFKENTYPGNILWVVIKYQNAQHPY